jgi:hypothetical protein
MSIILPSFAGIAKASGGPTGATGWASGQNYSLSMDGTDDYAESTAISALQNASAFSFSVWFKAGSSGEYPAFGGYTSGTDMISSYGSSPGLIFSVRGGHETRYEVDSSILPTDTTSFHHYAYTYSSGTHKVYVDGAEKSGTVINAGTTSTGAAAFTFKIGYQGFHYDAGLYDEFAIYSAALDSSAVTALYNSGLPGDISATNRVAWWRMEEGSGSSVVNTHNIGTNDLTLYNGATFSSTVPT